ncbi:MAG: trypsin-like peptidase domain-containing protein [Clostridiales bacterium]|nr:trypsin-like peptidase domain-containing protein [Clostridiales bacterium]
MEFKNGENNNFAAGGDGNDYTPPKTSPVDNTSGEYRYVPPQQPNPGQGSAQQQGGAQNGAPGGTQQQNYYNPTGTYTGQAYTDQAYTGQTYAAQTEPPKPKKPKKKISKSVIAIIVVVAVCIACAVGGIVYGLRNGNSGSTDTTNPSAGGATVQSSDDSPKTDDSGNLTTVGVVSKVMDSCVGITVYSNQSQGNSLYDYFYSNENTASSEPVVSGQGSGVLMYEDTDRGLTYILTCAHVIKDGTKFTVTANDGTEYDATMVGYDEQTDIGVLSMQATGLQIAEFGDSGDIQIGEDIIAIGNPGGLEYANSVTKGIVSGLDRPVSSDIGYDNLCIQVDAAINPGNSGGALFNMQGQVIGINSSKIAATDYEGIGFAIPSNTAVENANSIIQNGYVAGRAQIGIQYVALSNFSNADSIVSALNDLGFEDAEGTIVIDSVNSDSDLADQDIRQYDMIVAADDKVLTSTDVLTSVLSDKKPGDTIKLTVARIENNQIDTFEVSCVLGESKGNSQN